MIYHIVLVFYFFIFSILCGISDGFFWHAAAPRDKWVGFSKTENRLIHSVFWIIRCLYVLALSTNILYITGAALAFSLIHNSAYYETREYLKSGTYPKGWLSYSKTDQSLTGRLFTVPIRIYMFLLGLTCFLFYLKSQL